jgi:peptidyl-prolyl cis-trans isomerase B (cyclophilin B)
MRRVLSVLLVLVFAVAVFASCGEKKEEVVVDNTTTTTDQATKTDPGTAPTDTTPVDQGTTPADTTTTDTTPATNADLEKTIVFETNMGNIEFKLFADTPLTAKNMLDKVNAGFYNNLTFHRVIPNFMIQGGDPTGSGAGGGQMAGLDPRPNRKNVKGTLSMASSSGSQPIEHQSDCQFFINVNDNAHLDVPGYGFIVFAEVASGMDVCDKIANVSRDASDKPVSPVTILKAFVK